MTPKERENRLWELLEEVLRILKKLEAVNDKKIKNAK
jgi:hypothetical protein